MIGKLLGYTQVQTTPRHARLLDEFSVRSPKGIEHL